MKVNAVPRLHLEVSVPPDKSISHRSLIFNSVSTGTAVIEDPLDGDDVRSTARCLQALGCEIDWPAGSRRATVAGRGLHGLFEADDVLDCGNSGTTMRLLTGLLAAHPILSVLTGDASLRSRPMARVITPLRQMGAELRGRRGDTLPPLMVKGGPLRGISYRSPVASAQVKSAVILAGLYADGPTSFAEPGRSRDHTERMLTAMGAQLDPGEGASLILHPAARLEALSLRVPGDISSAAPWIVLAACHPDAEVHIRGVGMNETRTGIVDIARSMGADIELSEERSAGGEAVADIVVRTSKLRAATVSGTLTVRAIDELPLVAILGCFAEGETVVADAAELRAKESDRVESTVSVLQRMGARVTARPDGFVVRGPARLQGATVDAGGDHRIGMLAAVAGALADGTTSVTNDAVSVSYPAFWEDLASASRG